MCDYGNAASLLGLDTPVQSPSSENILQEQSYDIDALLASLSESSIVTPAASPETAQYDWTASFTQQQFEDAISLTPLDQFTSCIPEQDSSAYPKLCSSESIPFPQSTSCPSEFAQIDPESLYNLLLAETDTATSVQAIKTDGPQEADNFKSDGLYHNTDQPQYQDKVEAHTLENASAPTLEPHIVPTDTWNSEPLQPLFDLGIVDSPENVVLDDSSGTQAVPGGASNQPEVLPEQQAEAPVRIQWPITPHPTISPSTTVCPSQLQQLTLPQQLQFTVIEHPGPAKVDLSYQNLINAVERKRINSNPQRQADADTSARDVKAATLERTVIPVVSYSRNQLTVIPETVEPEPPQPAMSCAQLFASFAVSSPDGEPQLEDIMVVEEHPNELEVAKPSLKRGFVEVQNQYVIVSNGTNQAFEVQEMYKVVTEDDQIDEDPQPARKRQRRINIDYGTNFQCVPCGKTFGKKGSLEQHNRSHHTTEARPWHCDTCGKNFATEEKLQKHAANHDDRNKKFQCSACEKRYAHWKDCERHYQSSHGTPAFQCGQCGKAFVRRDHLLAHEVSHGRRHDRAMRKELKIPRRGGLTNNKS